MFLLGAQNLEAKKEWINELNVFPVPDGDTGINMTMTIMSAANEVSGLEEITIENLAKAISSGSLRGARGNSGVILSQLLRGFTKRIKEEKVLNAQILSEAFEKAVETAYKAVMKPKEGTILTVAKAMAEKSLSLAEEDPNYDLDVFLKEVMDAGDLALSLTPEQLPVLKEAGVVDSGGQGLMEVIHGAYAAYMGEEIDFSGFTPTRPSVPMNSSYNEAEVDIKFGYCTEFIVKLNDGHNEESVEDELRQYLPTIGDSIVAVADDGIVKIHVHTNDPGLALSKGLSYGNLSRIKIDNMREEHQEKLFKDSLKLAAEQAKAHEPKITKEFGVISVCAGEGLAKIFKDLNVDYVIQGGQTMNPSTDDFLKAIEQIPAKHIFILPNNKNIILAANQARDIVEDKKIIVIPTKTIPQGISAMIGFSESLGVEENEESMNASFEEVKSASVTYAVRDTTIDEKPIQKGDYMGIGDQGLLSVSKELDKATFDSIKEMVDEDTEVVSLYFGAELKEEDTKALVELIEEEYPDIECEVYEGNQPVYYYFISVE